jgi:hypothetical protein
MKQPPVPRPIIRRGYLVYGASFVPVYEDARLRVCELDIHHQLDHPAMSEFFIRAPTRTIEGMSAIGGMALLYVNTCF